MADRPTRSEAEPSETEIEITPDMLQAGCDELRCYDLTDADPRRVLTEVLVAMGAEVVPEGLLLRKRRVEDARPQTADSVSQGGRLKCLRVSPRGWIAW